MQKSKHTSKRIEKVTEELLPLAASESVPASGEVTGLGETAAAAAPPWVGGAGAAAAVSMGFFWGCEDFRSKGTAAAAEAGSLPLRPLEICE